MDIEYAINRIVSVVDFLALLNASRLAERRPVDDYDCLRGMLENSNLCVSAWHGDNLVGIARCMTDFHYACYLSDLAVDQDWQRRGIGRELLTLTQEQLGPKCKLILIAAPDADAYYPQLGFSNNPRCWVLPRNEKPAPHRSE